MKQEKSMNEDNEKDFREWLEEHSEHVSACKNEADDRLIKILLNHAYLRGRMSGILEKTSWRCNHETI